MVRVAVSDGDGESGSIDPMVEVSNGDGQICVLILHK